MRKLIFTLWMLFAVGCVVHPSYATVSTTSPRNDYVGTGSTATYSYTFKIFTAADLRVTTRDTSDVETTLTYPTDYTVTGAGSASGGTITLTAGNLTSGYALTIRFDRTPRQSTDLRNQGTFYPETHEDKFDELTRYSQQLEDVVDRSIHLPETEAGTAAATTLPAASSRADKFLAWDSSGNVIAAAGTSGTLGPVSSYINTLLDDADAATARATLGTDTGNATIDAKGDLLAGTADNTLGRVPASATTGLALVADPSAASGVSWSHRSQLNPIINGNADIWQRGASFAAVANNTTTADRFKWGQSGTGVVTINRSTNVPTVAQAGILFNYSLEVDVTTADAVVDATDSYTISTVIEGYDWRAFAQRDLVLSFWVMSSKTGVHAVPLLNSGQDRTIVGTYTVNAADTWEYKTITFPASPSAGTWDYTNGKGVQIEFVLGAGSNYQGTAGSWSSSLLLATSSQANVLDNTANFFRVTGVKLELGSVATPIQFIPFETELRRCQRYYFKTFHYTQAPAQNVGTTTGEAVWSATKAGAATNISSMFTFPVRLRTTPSSITFYNPSAANANVRDTTGSVDCTTPGLLGVGELYGTLQCTGNAATAVGNTLRVHFAIDAEF